MSEMAYKFKGAGHEEPEGKRKYEQSENKVAAALLAWIQENYEKSVYRQPILDRIKEQKPTIGEINSAVLLLREHPEIRTAGYFITELYKQLPDEEIVFDIETQDYINDLGDGLEKILINKGKIDSLVSGPRTLVNFGQASVNWNAETVVNYGKFDGQADWMLNYGAYPIGGSKPSRGYGHIINLGEIEFMTPLKDSVHGEVVINFGTFAKGVPYFKHVIGAKNSDGVIRQEDLDKIGFEGYLPLLKREAEKGRNDYHAALELLKALKGEPSSIQLPSIPKLLERLKNV